jgi:hypothetical protein
VAGVASSAARASVGTQTVAQAIHATRAKGPRAVRNPLIMILPRYL